MKRPVMVVDDDRDLCELVRDSLASRGFEVTAAHTLAQALEETEQTEFHVVISDIHLGDDDGLALCQELGRREPELPVVMITGYGNMDSAVASIRAGAYDFITKPTEMEALGMVVERADALYQLKREVTRLRARDKSDSGFESMIGDSPAMKRIHELIARLEGSDAPVLIQGESGTGKELVARAVHARSDYARGPFVAINTAAVPATLLESTLFGHMRGAFTDAHASRRGLFVEADRGTLFLDEIADMPIDMQAKLLRVLQERRVRPVGGSADVAFDARIVSASNTDLEEAVHRGHFREDLYYRLAVVTVFVEPLRNRVRDVLLLAQHFLSAEAARAGKSGLGISAEAARKLLDYDWPGNVRELQNVMARAVALTRFQEVSVSDLPDKIRDFEPTQMVIGDTPEQLWTLQELEQRYMKRVLRVAGGNKTRAAKILGVDRRTLHRKLVRLERVRRKAGD
jgi:two-component system response regulator HydG